MTTDSTDATFSEKVVEKHPLAIRWFHWINFPVIACMVWSGLLIFWANSDGVIKFFGKPALPSWVFAPAAPSWWPAWAPSTMTSRDGHDLKAIYDLQFRLAEGMGWHFFFAWFFVLNGVAYVTYLALSGQWKSIIPKKQSPLLALKVALHDVWIIKKKPPQEGVYNHAQRIAYTLVIAMGALMLVSGFAIYKPTQLWWLDRILGGYVMARWFHFWTTMALIAFFLVHVGQVVKTGWTNFRSMITGHDLERDEPAAPTSEPLITATESLI